jgi:HEAT repeat protein
LSVDVEDVPTRILLAATRQLDRCPLGTQSMPRLRQGCQAMILSAADVRKNTAAEFLQLAERSLENESEEVFGPAWSIVARSPEAGSNARIRPLAIKALESRQRAERAIWWLVATRDREAFDLLAQCLQHQDVGKRILAAQNLVRLDRDRAAPVVRPLLRDPEMYVRQAVASLAATLLDLEAVPMLLELLRDPVSDVREAAKDALTAIDLFHTQKNRWAKLLQGTGLEAGSAAEALIQQTRAEQPKSVRLRAIESLGTLATPESLPILIQLTQDKDSEIAAAAGAAVDRINKGKRN